MKKIQENVNQNINLNATFHPKTNNPQESLRKFDEFISSQANHTKKIEEHVKNMKEEREKNQAIPAQPIIDKVNIN